MMATPTANRTGNTRNPFRHLLFGVVAGVIFGVDVFGRVDVLSSAFDVDLLCGGYGFGFFGGTIMLCHVLPFEVKARSDSL